MALEISDDDSLTASSPENTDNLSNEQTGKDQSILAVRELGYRDALWYEQSQLEGAINRIDHSRFMEGLGPQYPHLTQEELQLEYATGVVQRGAEVKSNLIQAESQASRAYDLRRGGALPDEIREHSGYASSALEAFMGGQSIPSVALNYRYEPGQAEIFLRSVTREYGAEQLRGVVSDNVISTLQSNDYGMVDRISSAHSVNFLSPVQTAQNTTAEAPTASLNWMQQEAVRIREASELSVPATEADLAAAYWNGRRDSFNEAREQMIVANPGLEKDLPSVIEIDEIRVRQQIEVQDQAQGIER